ncbi:MAG: epimerase [Roseovarius sp.]
MQKTVLVLGATGRFGRHAADAFWNAGWTVRLFDRTQDDLVTQAMGADVIVAAWNPPFHQWTAQLPRLHARVREAARASGAAVLLPGNIHVYDPDTPAPWSEGTPHSPRTSLGRLRARIEQEYRDSDVQTILLRAGDFMDTEASDGWFDRVLMSRLRHGRLVYPGDTATVHSWAYLPDLARAAEQLARRKPELDRFEEVVFPGYAMTAQQIADLLSRISGRTVTARRMAWLPLYLSAPVWPLARGLIALRGQWDVTCDLQSDRLAELCPEYRDTPVEEAVSRIARPWLATSRVRCRPCYFTTRSTQTNL